jgi:ABC-2 type transport system permease protein
MSRWLHLMFHHLRFVALSFRRNATAAFFSVGFPLMFLIINSLLLGGNRIPIGGEMVSLTAYYVVSMSVFGVIMACFTSLAISVLFDRDQGRLKRLRGTPTPVSTYVAARVLFTTGIGLATSGLCVAIGTLFFGVSLHLQALALFALTIGIGSAAFTALGLAITAVIPNSQAGPAILNALTFPILFISSVFYPLQGAPHWLNNLAGALPVRPFADAAVAAFFGHTVPGHDLLVILVWGVVGAVLAAIFFRWQPVR